MNIFIQWDVIITWDVELKGFIQFLILKLYMLSYSNNNGRKAIWKYDTRNIVKSHSLLLKMKHDTYNVLDV